MNREKDKMVTMRFLPNDLVEANFNYLRGKDLMKNCPDMIDITLKKLQESLDEGGEKKLYDLAKKQKKMKDDKTFKIDKIVIADTEISAHKPFSLYVDSNKISKLQQTIIDNSNLQKPHSSWIIQLALLNYFEPIAKDEGFFDFDKIDDEKNEYLKEIDKMDMVEKFVALLKNEELNRDKIEAIKSILYY